MKKHVWKQVSFCCLVAVMTLLGAGRLMAQNATDKQLVGVWKMVSMKYEGETENLCGEKYTQVKVYGADGSYACAEIVRSGNGMYNVLPHEYGTYTYKNGVYMEMGRKTDADAIIWVNKDSFKGRWMRCWQKWERATDMPDVLVKYIVDKCKANQQPGDEMNGLIKKHLF